MHNEHLDGNGQTGTDDAGNGTGMADSYSVTRSDRRRIATIYPFSGRPIYTTDPYDPGEVIPEHPDEWRR